MSVGDKGCCPGQQCKLGRDLEFLFVTLFRSTSSSKTGVCGQVSGMFLLLSPQ